MVQQMRESESEFKTQISPDVASRVAANVDDFMVDPSAYLSLQHAKG